MGYVVIHEFKDLQDHNHVYRVGDKYPRSGRSKKDRIAELSGSENKIGVPLIREVDK
ncbi:hypothetical protein D3C81_309380 [compost metagenome]